MASSSRATGSGAAGDPLSLFLRGDREEEEDSAGGDDMVSVSSSELSAEDANAKKIDSKSHLLSVPGNEAKKVLFAMCLGLSADEDPDNPTEIRYLSEFDVEPYLSVKNKKPFRPMHKHLLDEIERRFEVLKIPADERFKRSDKIKATMNAARKWLKDHPLTNPRDVAFLRAEEKKFYDVQVMARLESRAVAGQKMLSAGGGGKIVLTRIADLRLVHCILHHEVKDAFLKRNNILEKPELDARNAPDHPLTWNQLVAAKFNDPDFEAVTEVFPELHSDFAQPISINRSDCPNNITPELVEFWVTDRKSKLLAVKTRHEQSGNGEGTRRRDISDNDNDGDSGNDDEEDDDLEYLPDNRAAYLQNERSTILYKWEMFKKYDILDNVLCILPAEMGVSTSNTSVATGVDIDTSSRRSRKRQKKTEVDSFYMSPPPVAMHTERTAAIDRMSTVLQSMVDARKDEVANARAALASASEAVADAEKTVLAMTEKLEEVSSSVVKAAYEARLQKAQERLVSAEERFAEADEVYKRTKREQQAKNRDD
jgi:hypothetical protein